MWPKVLQSGRREARCLIQKAIKSQHREAPLVKIWLLVRKISRLQSLLGMMKVQRGDQAVGDIAQLSFGRRVRGWVAQRRTLGMGTARCMFAAMQNRQQTTIKTLIA